MNIVITSEQRVGSRWLSEIVKDLTGKQVAPEIDGENPQFDQFCRDCFKHDKIVKLHHMPPEQVFERLPSVDKVIGVVRNPRDRIVSTAFHYRYHYRDDLNLAEMQAGSDEEAVRICVIGDHAKIHHQYNRDQFDYMVEGQSTRSEVVPDQKYIWTAYEWMLDDTELEVWKLLTFLIGDKVRFVVYQNSFEVASGGRQQGQEDRSNIRQRKAVVGDWESWFDEDMKQATIVNDEKYWDKLASEQNGRKSA